MKLELKVSDSMDTMRDSRPVRRDLPVWRIMKRQIRVFSLAEWVEAQRLLLAQVLAVAFGDLIIGDTGLASSI